MTMEPAKIGLLIFDDVEELDFVGPWEVLTSAEAVVSGANRKAQSVWLIAQEADEIQCAKGLRVNSDYTFDTAPPLDVLLVPGGMGTRREVDNPAMIEWIARTAQSCRWITSVCTGSLLLAKAGVVQGKTVTTHWAFADTFAGLDFAPHIDKSARYIVDGNVISAAGVSAGIDMAIHLASLLYGDEIARQTQKYIQYDPRPPYQIDLEPEEIFSAIS